MELNTNFDEVFCCGISEVKKAVIPVDCTMILPDYFPDVMKILRYTAKTVKSPVTFDGSAEIVSGNVNIEVNYVSENGELCYCSQLQPFSHSFISDKSAAAADAEITVGEIGCRAVNKRRIDLHGSIEAALHTVYGNEEKMISFAEGAGSVCKNKSLDTVLMVGEFYKNFTLEERGELEYGKTGFGKTLRVSATAQVTECHVIQDKIVTKGKVDVEVLWAGDNITDYSEEGPFLSRFSYPVSRMVDAKGILLTDICDASYEADFPEISPSDDGQNIIIKVKIGIFARVYRNETSNFVSDMFSTDYETKLEKKKITVIDAAFPVAVTDTVFERFELPETVESVTDMWLENTSPAAFENGKISYAARVCLFAKDPDGTPIYFERMLERECVSPSGERNIAFFNLAPRTESLEYTLSSDRKAEISASVLIDGTIYTYSSIDVIKNCTVSTERKSEHEDAALLLCFADKGECVWDIAKKYSVSTDKIIAENEISGEIFSEKTMLVIAK